MKKTLLPDFLIPQDGNCLSIYLPKIEGGDPASNRAYLSHVKREVGELLRWNTDVDKLKLFTKKVSSIIADPDLSGNKTQNVAVFITEEGSWDFKFTGHCKPFFSLATSFHIKPLLRYFHRNRKFFLLHFDLDQVTLYVDDPNKLKALDTIVYPKNLVRNLGKYELVSPSDKRKFRAQFKDFASWMSDWVSQDLLDETKPLILGGVVPLKRSFMARATYPNMVKVKNDIYHDDGELVLFSKAKEIVSRIADEEENKALSYFKLRIDQACASTDLKTIAKAASRSNLEMLFVARDEHVWGELNRITGDVKMHFEQLTDLDDDLLDDLAEMALHEKSKVMVLDRSKMPGGKPIAAVFKLAPEELKVKSLFSVPLSARYHPVRAGMSL